MKKNPFHYLILLVVCLAAYFQVAFLLESLRWDNLDSYLPMRYFVSECLRNSIFPLWLPYQGLGCPIFGDLISTNYPEAFFTGRLIVYDNIVLQLFFMAYVFLAAIGMYKLSRQLKIKAEMSVILAIAYALSGFFIGNGQHIQYTISGAWIPFILKYYLQMGTDTKIPAVLKFILFTYLQVSGGYPAHTIFLAYLTPAGEMYLIKGDNTPEKFSGTLWPWRQNVQAEQREQVLSFPLSSIGGGNTIFYSMVTTDPNGFTKYDLIYFQKALQ